MAISAPLALHSKGQDVSTLHEQLQKVGVPVPEQEAAGQAFAAGTQSAVQAFQRQAGLSVTGVVDDRTSMALAQAVAAAGEGQATVAGRLFYEDQRVAAGVRVNAIQHGFADVQTKLGEAVSDADGYYVNGY